MFPDICPDTDLINSKRGPKSISGPRCITTRDDLELPANGELHDAPRPRFAQRFLSRRKHAKGSRQIGRVNRAQSELSLQERINRTDAESRRTSQALRVGDVKGLPPQGKTLTLGNMKRLVETGVDIEIAGQS